MLPSCFCFQRHSSPSASDPSTLTSLHISHLTSRQPDACHPHPMQLSAVKRQRGLRFGCVPSKGCASWKQHQSGGWPCPPE